MSTVDKKKNQETMEKKQLQLLSKTVNIPNTIILFNK